jgi:NADH dehydrogenase/NADH:ubiquinone oxidoreductase subunit G
VAVVQGPADALLVKADKAADAAGARALGFGDARAVLDRLRSGGVDGLIAMGHDVLDAQFLGGVELLARLDTLIVLDTHRSALEQVANVVFPVRVAAEKHGTLTNFAGLVQAVRPAVEPSWEALADGEVLRASARRSRSSAGPRAGTCGRGARAAADPAHPNLAETA